MRAFLVLLCASLSLAAFRPHDRHRRGLFSSSSSSCAGGCPNAAATGTWKSSAPFKALTGTYERVGLSLELHVLVTAACTVSGHFVLRDAEGRTLRTELIIGAWSTDHFEVQTVRGGLPTSRHLALFVRSDGTLDVTATSANGSTDNDLSVFRVAGMRRVATVPPPAAARLPNVLFLYVDDLGYADFNVPAFHGRTNVRTPNTANLAAQGMTMTSFYAGANVCTPSRSALLSGRFPIRVGMENDNFRVLISTGMRAGLQNTTKLVSGMLQDAGYRTGMVGKWHVGVGGQRASSDPNSMADSLMPWNRGFESGLKSD